MTAATLFFWSLATLFAGGAGCLAYEAIAVRSKGRIPTISDHASAAINGHHAWTLGIGGGVLFALGALMQHFFGGVFG